MSLARQSVINAIIHFILLVVTIFPVLSVDFLPLADLLNHLARLHIIVNLDSTPALQANYEVVSSMSPYLLVDWLLIPFAKIWSVYDVGRAFVVVTMVLTYFGIVLLSMTLSSRLHLWPALTLPILYNYSFAWGFVSFNFGVALMFLSLAVWFRTYHRSSVYRVFYLMIASAILYLTHMLAFGLFAAIIGSSNVFASYKKYGLNIIKICRESIPIVVPLLSILVVYMFWLSDSSAVGEGTTRYGSLIEKFVAVISPTYFSGKTADLYFFAIYFIVGLALAYGKKLRLARHMHFSLFVFFCLCLMMPATLFGVWGVDFRLTPVFLMFLIAVTLPSGFDKGAPATIMTVIIIGLVLARVITVWPQFKLADRQFAEFKVATSRIAEGSRVLVTQDPDSAKLGLRPATYWHLAQMSIIERNTFVPFLFTGVTQVRASVRNSNLDTASGHPLLSEQLIDGMDSVFISNNKNRTLDVYHRIYWAEWHENFDYLVQISPGKLNRQIAARLENTLRYDYFAIAKIRK